MILIYKAELKDIELLRALAREIWTSYYTSILSDEQIEYMLHMMYSSSVIEQEILSGVVWEIIALDEEPVGFISMSSQERGEVKLNKLYMKTGHHGKGYGQKVLSHVIDFTRLNGYERVFLTVNKNNLRAIKAYENAGFVKSESKVFDIGNGFVMDDYIMCYNI